MIWDPNAIIETPCIDLFAFLKIEFEKIIIMVELFRFMKVNK
jgi:hypothetical protein